MVSCQWLSHHIKKLNNVINIARSWQDIYKLKFVKNNAHLMFLTIILCIIVEWDNYVCAYRY